MTSRLKKIELQGYKTFANKVSFDFPLPITAIVGPNGSGKSNISDSIRWVLGEQSFTLLRGRKTMDMIFSGSDKKPRAGMASATITFDNHDQWLPIDYEEVSITRRAYRDGQNEYLLNGQKVRLKDINELLAQSGLAERTYTIIGQGLIDNALSSKPEDRRRFFEEAAGIGLYRGRQEEAQTRIKDTAHNMERISDILSELEPRVQSLQRQAKRAAEYERISGELKELLKDWYGYHWHKSQNDLLLAQERCKTQETRTREARESFAKLERDSGAQQTELKNARLALSELHNASAASHSRIDKINRDIAILDERLNSLQTQIRNFNDESESLNEESELLLERKGELDSEYSDLEERVKEAAEQKKHYEEELNKRQKEYAQLKADLREKRNTLSGIETDIIRAKAKRDELQDREDRLSASIPGMEQALERSETGLRAIRKEIASFSAIDRENENKRTLLEQQIEKEKAAVESLSLEERSLRKEQTDLESGLSRRTARLEVLNDAERNLTGFNQGAQFILKNAKQGKISGNIRSFGSLLMIPKEYEKAVAAALGDELDGLMIRSDEWDFVMDLLNSGGNGRAVLIPESFENRSVISQNGSPGGLPALLSLIRSDSAFHPSFEHVLAGKWLAGSRAEALKYQSELKPGQAIVTLNGDLFRADGSVVSGNEGRTQVLSRTREMSTLRDDISELEEALRLSGEKRKALETELNALRKSQEALSKERSQLNASMAGVQKKLGQLAIENEKQTQTAVFQRQRIEESRTQLKAAAAERNACQESLTVLDRKREAAQEAIREAQTLLNRIQLAELQDQAHHWSVSLAVLQKSVTEMKARIREAEDAIVKNRNRGTANRDRVYELEKQIGEINEQKEELTSDAAEAAERNEAITAQIAPAEILVKEAERKVFSSQGAFQNVQQHVTTAERLLAQAQLEVTRQDDKLESLRKRIEDDFGLVNFTYSDQIAGQGTLPLGEMVSELPQPAELKEGLDGQIQQRKNYLRRIGVVNPEAIAEYKEASERYHFLKTQLQDLKNAQSDLRETITELERMMENAFLKTFEEVQKKFTLMFSRLFGGGSAKLKLTDPEDVNTSGIEIEAKLPGHREQELSLLSGGERSLTSVALVFALLRVSPTPFCVMDEVDAALDEANVGRFCELLKDLSKDTQFLIITHNRNTVEASNVIYGVTMASDSTSQIVSLRLDEVSKLNKEFLK